MFPCHAAVALQSIPTFKVSNNCRATESSPATNLKRGTTSRRSPREVVCKLSAGKSRCQYSSEMLETNGFYQTFARQRRSSVRSSSLHVRDGSSALQQAPVPSVRRRHVKSRAPIPFSAHPRSIDGGSSPDNLPLATGSGTKAMAEAMRAKKVAICLYMVAIEGEKLTRCWFGPAPREARQPRSKSRQRAKTRTPKPGGHCEIARKSSSCQYLLEAIRVFPPKKNICC